MLRLTISIPFKYDKVHNGRLFYVLEDISFDYRSAYSHSFSDVGVLLFGNLEVRVSCGDGLAIGVEGRTNWMHWHRASIQPPLAPPITGSVCFCTEDVPPHGVAYEIWNEGECYEAYDVSTGWYLTTRSDKRATWHDAAQIEFVTGCRFLFSESEICGILLKPVNAHEIAGQLMQSGR